MVTKEDALLMFAKWRDEETCLRVVAKLSPLHLDSTAVVNGFDWNRFSLRLPGNDNFFELDFGNSSFNFGEHPEAPEGSVLVCLRPDGEVFFMEQIK